MTDKNHFDVGIEIGGVPVRCDCAAGELVDAQAWDGDPDSPTFGVTLLPLCVPAFHDVAVTARAEEHPYRPQWSRVSMTLWGRLPGCTHNLNLPPEAARRLAAQLLEAADEVDQLRS